MKHEQKLSFYPLPSFEYIDHKIKEIGQYWRYLEDIQVTFEGGAYRLEMIAKEQRTI